MSVCADTTTQPGSQSGESGRELSMHDRVKTLIHCQSQAHNANSSNYSRRKWLSDVVRNDCSINFHLSKLSIAKFSILYDISLVRDWRRKLKLITLGSERVKGFSMEIKKRIARKWTVFDRINMKNTMIVFSPRFELSFKIDFDIFWNQPWLS